MVQLLMQLMDAFGPSGSEETVRKIIQKEIKPYVDSVLVDSMGNLICHKKGKGQKVMLAAHMDEIGLMVEGIFYHGHIKVSTVGFMEVATLIGQQVAIIGLGNKLICNGVLTYKNLHESEEITELPTLRDLYVDTGLTPQQLKKHNIEVGSYIVPTHKSRTLANPQIISGKAIDDRVGCYILIELARRLKKCPLDLYFVFTVQEEVGLYGAKTSVYSIAPSWGIVVDATGCPDSDFSDVLGKGPQLTLKDAEMLANPLLSKAIRDVAKMKKIPLQLEVSDIGTTDATSMMFSKGGVPSAVVGIPVRNLHSTVGIAHMQDISHAIALLQGLFTDPKICKQLHWGVC